MRASVKKITGLVKIVVKQNFVGVVAAREEQAIRAARELKITWQESPSLPSMEQLADTLRKIPSNDKPPANSGDVDRRPERVGKDFNRDLSLALSIARVHGAILRRRRSQQ